MKNTILFLLCVLTFSLNAQTESDSISTYYFIRHAEKDRSDKTNKNPNLTEKGIHRAIKWSQVLSNMKFDAIYSTDYNRTKQTAKPTAEKQNKEITLYDPRTIAIEQFLKENKGKTVLVVGHSNTTPSFVNGILGTKKYDQIEDNNNGNLYIVTITNSQEKTSTLLEIN